MTESTIPPSGRVPGLGNENLREVRLLAAQQIGSRVFRCCFRFGNSGSNFNGYPTSAGNSNSYQDAIAVYNSKFVARG